MPCKARRSADPTALLQMRYDVLHLSRRHSRLLQRRAPALAERLTAVPTAPQPNILLLAHPLVYPQLAPLGWPHALVLTGRFRTCQLRSLFIDP